MGRFKPGQSGNPGGRPKGFAGLAAEIRERTDGGRKLVEFALKVLDDNQAKHRDRIAALQWLGDRGFGRPMQSVEITAAIAPAPSFDITGLSLDEQRQLLELMQRARAALPAGGKDCADE